MDRVVALIAAVLLVLSVTPVAGASPPPSGSAPPAGWTAAVLPQAPGEHVLVKAVAAGPEGLVAVGERTCDRQPGEGMRCWGQPWTSADGIAWRLVEAQASGLDLGHFRPSTSGPEIGVGGVAYGPGGYVAFGRAQASPNGPQRTAIWRSVDGSSWERVPTSGAIPRSARLRAILGASDGYLVGGVIYGERAPRAAIWSSPDGVTWTLARGRDAFDIGGYIDTMEDPASGGVAAFALYPAPDEGSGSLADGVVAVGEACMSAIDGGIWAWGGQCWGALWRSPDGLSWRRDSPFTPMRTTAVAAVGERVVVAADTGYGWPPMMAVSDDATDWRVPYGSPVDGELAAMTAAAGRFHAILVNHPGQDVPPSLAVWSSDDGADWRLDEEQPSLPAAGSPRDVALTVAGDRLLLVAGIELAEGPVVFESVVWRGPALE